MSRKDKLANNVYFPYFGETGINTRKSLGLFIY